MSGHGSLRPGDLREAGSRAATAPEEPPWSCAEGHSTAAPEETDRERGLRAQLEATQAALRASEERLRSERGRLEAIAQALAETNQRKDEFLAVVSHELRNPLAPIRSSLYVMERAQPGSETALRMRAILERQVSHLTRLVDDLLDVTRVSLGKIQLQRERIELGDLVRHALEDHRAAFAAEGIRLEGRVTTRPIWLAADPTRVEQIIGNLLGNAAKFTPSGGRVEVALEQERGEAVLSVRDSGVGITREALGSLFRPFTQADRTLDRARRGLGLGLALVKALAELHGGSVAAVSEGAGRGAEFIVRLPLETAFETRAVADAARPARRARVLVIDDNKDGADGLQQALELMGHEVRVAYDGLSGITEAAAFRPQYVLCDIGLPGMDGYEVARQLRSRRILADTTVLVAVTGYVLPEDQQRAAEAGFRYHVSKPASLELLDSLLRS